MERGKKSYTEEEQWIMTAEHLSKHIPGCEELIDYKNCWSSYAGGGLETIQEIQKEICNSVIPWLESESPEICTILKQLHPAAKKHLKQILPPDYKLYFTNYFKGLPNEFAVPTPFLVMKDTGEQIILKRPFVQKYGDTIKLELRGAITRAEDSQLTCALIMLMQIKPILIGEKTISYTTTIEEIARTLRKKHPTKESTRNAIWAGLTRLNDCRMTLTNAKGLRTLGGILSGAHEIEEDSMYEIRIHLDRDFVNLYEEGYTKLDPEIFFTLTNPTLINLYKYLCRNEFFNKCGTFSPVHIFKIYNYAGLGGINPDEKTEKYKRRVIKQAFQELKNRGIITGDIVYPKPDIISIVKSLPKSTTRDTPKLKLERNIPKKNIDIVCPAGFVFREDYWKDQKICSKCKYMEECYK